MSLDNPSSSSFFNLINSFKFLYNDISSKPNSSCIGSISASFSFNSLVFSSTSSLHFFKNAVFSSINASLTPGSCGPINLF